MFTAIVVAAAGLFCCAAPAFSPDKMYVPPAFLGAVAIGGALIGAGFCSRWLLSGHLGGGLVLRDASTPCSLASDLAGPGLCRQLDLVERWTTAGESGAGDTLPFALGVPEGRTGGDDCRGSDDFRDWRGASSGASAVRSMHPPRCVIDPHNRHTVLQETTMRQERPGWPNAGPRSPAVACSPLAAWRRATPPSPFVAPGKPPHRAAVPPIHAPRPTLRPETQAQQPLRGESLYGKQSLRTEASPLQTPAQHRILRRS